MNFFLDVLKIISGSFILLPQNIYFWVVIVIMYQMYRSSERLEKASLGEIIPARFKISTAVFSGVLAGAAGSVIVLVLGITLQHFSGNTQNTYTSGIYYIIALSLLLALIDTRFVCFSYAGGIIALCNLIFGFPDINVVGLLALIGLLHLLESFLIWIDGYANALPIYVRAEDGSISGGFLLNRIWPIPIIILFTMITKGSGAVDGINTPEWWPIIKQSAIIGIPGLIYYASMVPAVSGYKDMTLTAVPKAKCRKSATRLALYSVVLIILSIIASRIYFVTFIAAIFAPLAHELLIMKSKKDELTGKHIFTPAEKGLKILYIKGGQVASRIGIFPGDIILRINNKEIETLVDVDEALKDYPTVIWVDIITVEGKETTLEYSDYQNGVSNLGILTVPGDTSVYFEMKEGQGLIRHWIDRLRKK